MIMHDDELYQFKGYAYRLTRLWWFPFVKRWRQAGRASGMEKHLFPAPVCEPLTKSRGLKYEARRKFP
jgi:hypothetical protein